MKILLILCLAYVSNIFAIFDYDRAIHAGQRNKWTQSSDLLKQVLVEKDDRADVLYDLGVSSFKNKEFEQALSYFKQAAQKTSNTQLQEQAHFNAGNTHVQLKQLQEAIKEYDKVLAINPNNKNAAHNKEIVKKMLEQQKQEQEKQDQNKNDKHDDQQDKQNQNKQDQQQNRNEDDKKNDDEQNKQNDDKQNQQEQKKDEQKSNDMTQSSDQREQKKNQDKKSQPQKEQQKDQPQASASTQQAQNSRPNDIKQEQEQLAQKVSPQLMRVLEQHEKKDAELNKQVIKAMAGQPGESNDRNNW